ncbi:MAG TPA: hypothetical protein VGM90_03400 [Kofleriaceae bacterium]
MLVEIDLDLAETARQAGCACSGVLHSARYPRKPRGLPSDHRGDDRRASFCCATCRRRTTPASVRFLGRRIYLGAMVVLATALQQGPSPWRLKRLRELFGVSRQTLVRWRTWWTEALAESEFWKAARASFSPPVAVAAAPSSLLERFAGEAQDQLAALLRLLAPLSTTKGYVPDRCR